MRRAMYKAVKGNHDFTGLRTAGSLVPARRAKIPRLVAVRGFEREKNNSGNAKGA